MWYCAYIRLMLLYTRICNVLDDINRDGLFSLASRLYKTNRREVVHTRDTLQEIWNSLTTGSLLMLPVWIILWCVSSGAQGVVDRGVRACEDVKLTMSRVYTMGDDLFGRIYYKVASMRDRAEVYIDSYSQLPQHINLHMIQEHIRRNPQVAYLRNLVAQNVEIPVFIADMVRGYEHMFSLVLEDGELSLHSSMVVHDD